MNLPKITTYGEYKSGNYGANSLRVDIGALTLYFSYETIVDFHGVEGLKVRQNDWSTTTGKHLNWIDGGGTLEKKKRLPGQEFEELLTKELARYGLTQ